MANYTEFVGCDKWDEITYVSPRWLSFEQCCGSETKRFEALKSIFLLQDEKNSTKRFKRLSNDFADPLTDVHVAFFTAGLPIFTNYNKFLQRNDPLPHKILPMKNVELLYEQFHQYKTINDAELPDKTYEEALLSGTSDGNKKEYRVDVICYYLQKMRIPVGPNYWFKLLFEVARIVLTMPLMPMLV